MTLVTRMGLVIVTLTLTLTNHFLPLDDQRLSTLTKEFSNPDFVGFVIVTLTNCKGFLTDSLTFVLKPQKPRPFGF